MIFCSHSRVEVYAVNANNEFISAIVLQRMIQGVMDDDRLERLGFNITVSLPPPKTHHI